MGFENRFSLPRSHWSKITLRPVKNSSITGADPLGGEGNSPLTPQKKRKNLWGRGEIFGGKWKIYGRGQQKIFRALCALFLLYPSSPQWSSGSAPGIKTTKKYVVAEWYVGRNENSYLISCKSIRVSGVPENCFTHPRSHWLRITCRPMKNPNIKTTKKHRLVKKIINWKNWFPDYFNLFCLCLFLLLPIFLPSLSFFPLLFYFNFF